MAGSPFEVAATGIIQAFNSEFRPEGFELIADHLHESLGRTAPAFGISPERDILLPNNSVVQETRLLVQFYDLWDQKIDPATVVSPFTITAYAERFRQMIKRTQVNYAGSDQVWYFDVESISYPKDPTGNKTRFEAVVCAYGNNAGLIETAG